jgi:hypothetical protein
LKIIRWADNPVPECYNVQYVINRRDYTQSQTIIGEIMGWLTNETRAAYKKRVQEIPDAKKHCMTWEEAASFVPQDTLKMAAFTGAKRVWEMLPEAHRAGRIPYEIACMLNGVTPSYPSDVDSRIADVMRLLDINSTLMSHCREDAAYRVYSQRRDELLQELTSLSAEKERQNDPNV